MMIGVPKEIKDHEYRVSVTPAGVTALCDAGHSVLVQRGAGAAIGFSDESYQEAGARLTSNVADVLTCPMVVKVKEPQAVEIEHFYEGQLLFTYLHLAPDPGQVNGLLDKRVTAIAYETVVGTGGSLPLLVPMSEVAGRMSILAGAQSMQMASGGTGRMPGGVPGVLPAKICIVGGGVVGTEAAKMALGLGADVTILDISLERLRYLDDVLPGIKTRYSTRVALAEETASADLVIGAVLIPGKKAPALITRDMIRTMKPGSVLVDVAIDQGGCAETSKATTHSSPTYVVDDVVHYCVANMPGAYARTSTEALTNATLPYVLKLANKGFEQALREDAGFAEGLNIFDGHVTNRFVAEATDKPCKPVSDVLGMGGELLKAV